MSSDLDDDTLTPQTGWISLSLKDEFETEVETKRQSLLSNIIIDGCIDKLGWNASVGSILLVTLLLAATLFIITSLISFLWDRSFIFFLAQTSPIDFKSGSYILVFLCLVGVGQGAYCAVVIPTLAREISKHRLELFWFKPADSPWINDASAFFTKLSMADALIVFLGICGLFLLRPFESTRTAWVASVWLVIGIVVLSYTFLFPHHYLTQVIRREKKRQIKHLQSLITSYEVRIEQLNAAEYNRLLDHINLYNCLSGSRDNAIDVEAWLKYVSSLGVPILAFVGGLAAKRLGLS